MCRHSLYTDFISFVVLKFIIKPGFVKFNFLYSFEGLMLGRPWMGRAEEGKIVFCVDPIKTISIYVAFSMCGSGENW
jgi:hypothetical protein